MLRTQDPADAGVTTALERARSLHDRVRAAANTAKANRRTTDGQELVALSFVRSVQRPAVILQVEHTSLDIMWMLVCCRDKLALLEDKLREYRLLNAYDSQAKVSCVLRSDDHHSSR